MAPKSGSKRAAQASKSPQPEKAQKKAEALPAVTEGEPSAAAEVQSVPTPVSASSSNAKPRNDDVDLSFASFDGGKPMRFIKRTMGEAKRLLNAQGLAEAKTGGYTFTLLDRQNLSKWHVQIRDLNPDGQLSKDLTRHKLDSCIDLEMSLPDEFPMAPPFVRVVYPHLAGGFVFQHGGICFEPLTAKGWVASMTLPALAIAIKGIFDFGDVRVAGPGCRETRTVKGFTEEGARKDARAISNAHRDGESSTYGSMKYYKS